MLLLQIKYFRIHIHVTKMTGFELIKNFSYLPPILRLNITIRAASSTTKDCTTINDRQVTQSYWLVNTAVTFDVTWCCDLCSMDMIETTCTHYATTGYWYRCNLINTKAGESVRISAAILTLLFHPTFSIETTNTYIYIYVCIRVI